MSDFWNRKGVKVYATYINPIIIGIIIPIALDSWKDRGIKFYATAIIGVVLLILYIYTSYIYEKANKDSRDEIEKQDEQISKLEEKNKQFKKKIHSYDKGMRELTALFYDSSTSVNTLSKKMLAGNITLDVWNFKRVATSVCTSVYNLLCDLCTPDDDFTVNIVLSDVTATGNRRNITMIAHKGKYETYPDKFEEKMYFHKYPSFYAIKLFKSKSTAVKVLTTKEEVNEHFVYVNEDHPEYSQYVGIPIVCSGSKMVCLLQICAFGNAKIGKSKAEIVELVQEYVIPFTHFALLAYKVEKGFVSSLALVDKVKEESKSGKN